MNETEVQRVAGAINALRPDWPVASLRTLIGKHLQTRAYRDVALALTWVACDPASRTPKRVVEPGPWWLASAPQRWQMGAQPPPFCHRCQTPHEASIDCHPDDLTHTRLTDATERFRQAAREAAAQAIPPRWRNQPQGDT